MKLVKISKLFDVEYGHSLELNRLTKDNSGINFVSRTSKNNGVSAIVKKLEDLEPNEAGTLTVSLGGSVLETFLQTKPYYTGYHIYCLTPKIKLTIAEKLYYCSCISANKFRYNYGRQANRTLRDLLIPDYSEIPKWVNEVNANEFDDANEPFKNINSPNLQTEKWKEFRIDELFDIKKGKRLTKANMKDGEVPFIGAIDRNNGYRQFIGQKPIHEGNTISVNYNGSVAEAFYQPNPFWASDDVNVLYPKFKMNQYQALFIASLIKLEKYRFNYGRKWHLERMNSSVIKLPVTNENIPDYCFMENYIKTLDYSKMV